MKFLYGRKGSPSLAVLQFLLSAALVVATFSGCGNDNFDDGPTGLQGNETIDIDVQLPETLSQGLGAVDVQLQAFQLQSAFANFHNFGVPFGSITKFSIPKPQPAPTTVRVDLKAPSTNQILATAFQTFQVPATGNPPPVVVPPTAFGPPQPPGVITPPAPPPPPVAVDDAYNTPYETTLVVPEGQGLLVNDTGGGASVAVSAPPSSGTLTLDTNGSFTYVPASGFSGQVTFVYTLTDSNANSDNATVTITVAPPPPPNAADDVYNALNTATLTVNAAQGVTANDTSINGTVSLVSGPANGTLTLNPDGSFTYTAPGAFTGDVTFTYRLSDANGSDTATVTISVASNIIFVRAGASGTGNTQASPRGDLIGALGAANNGTVVFILSSGTPINLVAENTAASTPTNDSFFIPDGVSVIGEGTGLSPTIPPGTRPVVEGNFDLGNGSRLSGVELVCQSRLGSDSVGVTRAAANASGLRLDNCLLRGSSHKIQVNGVVGAFTIEGNTFNGGLSTVGSAFTVGLDSSSAVLTVNDNEFDKNGVVNVSAVAGQNPRFEFTNNRSISGADIQQGFLVDARNGCRPVIEATGNNLQTASISRVVEFEFRWRDTSGIQANVRNNTFNVGRVIALPPDTVQANATGSVFDIKDNIGMGATMDFLGSSNAQVRFQNNSTSTPLESSGLSSMDVSVDVEDNATVSALFQNNSHFHGAQFRELNASDFALALVNNQFGTGTSGPGRLELTIRAFNTGTGKLCLKGSGNTVGSNLILDQDDNHMFLVEGLTAFVNGTVAGSKTVSGNVQNAAAGTCVTPTPLP